MNFTAIDMESWNRKEHFEYYMNTVRCSYSVVVNVDITMLRKKIKAIGVKDYITQIYVLSSVVNKCPEFRMSLDENGQLGCWDVVNPLYTVLHKEKETFSSIWTPYDGSFEKFYTSCISDIDEFGTGAFSPKPNCPGNIFTVSSVPWIDFSAFNINVFSEGTYLLPIFTIGKYIEDNGKILMPLAIQVHHAVCDGLHVGRFIEKVRAMVDTCEQWLPQ